MSTNNNMQAEAADKMCCASCGVAEVDDIKLNECNNCDLVRYCSNKCQQEHRMQHKVMCKERAAELRDENLFRQPESSHLGDCPICCLPLPIDSRQHKGQSCCSKIICMGCAHANCRRQVEGQLDETCPFCRQPQPKWEEEIGKNHLKRIESNNPFAMLQMGRMRHKEGDYESAFDHFAKAAELGDLDAHFLVAGSYGEGKGVEKDEKKEIYHLEEAAIGGHPGARCVLGCREGNDGRTDRGVKHFIIAASLGFDGAIQALKKCYAGGVVSKEDFATALRAHQAAVEATKSPHREAAAKVMAAFYKKSTDFTECCKSHHDLQK